MKNRAKGPDTLQGESQNSILMPAMVLSAIALACVLLILVQDQGAQETAVVTSFGETILELDLNKTEDLTHEVDIEGKINTIHITEGKAAVVFANCPDQICVNQGYNNEKSIICLPHQLIIRFHSQEDSYDAFSG